MHEPSAAVRRFHGPPKRSSGPTTALCAFARTSMLGAVIVMAACGSPPDQHTKAAEGTAALHASADRYYTPGLGDMMQAVQVRHAKLWYAGAHANWELAAFELHELHEGFEKISRWHPEHDGFPIAASIEAYMEAGLHALERSIERRDAAEFEVAFGTLTEGCNGCHGAAKHPFIVIQRPERDAFGNQRWLPDTPRE